MKIYVTYASGKTETVTSGYVCSPTQFNTPTSNQKVTVLYGGMAASFYVKVEE